MMTQENIDKWVGEGREYRKERGKPPKFVAAKKAKQNLSALAQLKNLDAVAKKAGFKNLADAIRSMKAK